MFGLFKKKDHGPTVTEKIVIAKDAKLEAMLAYWKENPATVFIYWFDDDLAEAEFYFAAKNSGTVPLMIAREMSSLKLSGNHPVFGEHYPLPAKEMELYERLGLSNVTVFSSLQEPLFKLFGADKIIQLMGSLGVKEDEVIEHKMISKSIRNAQEKIEKKVLVEHAARSQQDWIEKNLPLE